MNIHFIGCVFNEPNDKQQIAVCAMREKALLPINFCKTFINGTHFQFSRKFRIAYDRSL